MRVCLFTSSFLPLVGGAERAADLIVRGLNERNHQAMVLAQQNGAVAENLPYPVRYYRRLPRQYLWPETLAWPLFSAYRAWRFDVILAFDSYRTGYPACWIKNRLGAAVVVSPRGEDIEENFFKLERRRVSRCLAAGYRNADRIVAVSRWAASRVRAIAGGRVPPIDVVYNGIDMAAEVRLHVRTRKNPPRLPLTGPYILHLGRVNQNKQQITAVRAVHILRDEFRRRRLTYAIVGDGRGMAELRREIDLLGVADIIACLGTQTGAVKAWLYDQALFCVAASLSEAGANVIVEAMAAGKPTLASDIPTHREMLSPHRAGLFFDAANAASMARQITRMLDEGPALSHNAFAACREFSLKAMIDGYERSCLAAMERTKDRVQLRSACAENQPA